MEKCPNCQADVIPENLRYEQNVCGLYNVSVYDDLSGIEIDNFDDIYDDVHDGFWCTKCNTELPYSWKEMEAWLIKNHSLDKHLSKEPTTV